MKREIDMDRHKMKDGDFSEIKISNILERHFLYL